MEVRRDVGRVADFLERQHVRPERIDKARVVLLENLAQREARVEQQVFLFPLRHVRRLFRVVIVAENIVRHRLDVEARTLVRDRDPLRDLHEVVRVHVLFHELRAALRHGHREERLVLVAGKDAVKILHDHGKSGIIMPFLLRQHQAQSRGRLNGYFALDRTNPTHSALSFI